MGLQDVKPLLEFYRRLTDVLQNLLKIGLYLLCTFRAKIYPQVYPFLHDAGGWDWTFLRPEKRFPNRFTFFSLPAGTRETNEHLVVFRESPTSAAAFSALVIAHDHL